MTKIINCCSPYHYSCLFEAKSLVFFCCITHVSVILSPLHNAHTILNVFLAISRFCQIRLIEYSIMDIHIDCNRIAGTVVMCT